MTKFKNVFLLAAMAVSAVFVACDKGDDEDSLKGTTLTLTKGSETIAVEFSSATAFTATKNGEPTQGTYTFVESTLTLTFSDGTTITVTKSDDGTFTGDGYTGSVSTGGDDPSTGNTEPVILQVSGLEFPDGWLPDSIGLSGSSIWFKYNPNGITELKFPMQFDESLFDKVTQSPEYPGLKTYLAPNLYFKKDGKLVDNPRLQRKIGDIRTVFFYSNKNMSNFNLGKGLIFSIKQGFQMLYYGEGSDTPPIDETKFEWYVDWDYGNGVTYDDEPVSQVQDLSLDIYLADIEANELTFDEIRIVGVNNSSIDINWLENLRNDDDGILIKVRISEISEDLLVSLTDVNPLGLEVPTDPSIKCFFGTPFDGYKDGTQIAKISYISYDNVENGYEKLALAYFNKDVTLNGIQFFAGWNKIYMRVHGLSGQEKTTELLVNTPEGLSWQVEYLD